MAFFEFFLVLSSALRATPLEPPPFSSINSSGRRSMAASPLRSNWVRCLIAHCPSMIFLMHVD